MKRLMQWITWSPARLVTVAVVVALAIGGTIYALTRPAERPAPPAVPSPTATPSGEVAPDDAEEATEAAPTGVATAAENEDLGSAEDPVSETVLEPVQTYLQAKENQLSANRQEPTDWLTDARPALTADYYDALTAQWAAASGGSLGWEWDEYHTAGWTVDVTDLSCHPHADVYDPTARETALVCSYNATLLNADGGQAQDVPFGWYDTRTALISVTQADGWWRVSGDSTGQAG